MGLTTYATLLIIIFDAITIVIFVVSMSIEIIENQYRDNSTFGLQLNNASRLDPWNTDNNPSVESIVSFALAVILMVLVYVSQFLEFPIYVLEFKQKINFLVRRLNLFPIHLAWHSWVLS